MIETRKKANLADIIAKKQKGEMDKLCVKYYKSEVLGMDIEIRKIKLQEYMKLLDNDDDTPEIDEMNQIIFACCPLFKENAKEAMEVYGVAEPSDLPSAILEEQLNEMADIVNIINSFYGLDKVDKTIKN